MKTYYIYIFQQVKEMELYTQELQVIFKKVKGFTEKYNVNKLVYIEQTINVYGAITREKQLKKWNRSQKLRLIEENNNQWNDLSEFL